MYASKLVIRARQRFESARRLSFLPANTVKVKSPRHERRRFCQQYVSSRLSQSLILGIGVLRVVAGYSGWRRRILW
jgi:hypothetical protein